MTKPCITFAFILLGMVFSHAQGSSLSGTVRTAAGEPLPGATIFLPGLERGTAADSMGAYRLDDLPPGNHRLRVSFVGYEPHEQALRLSADQDRRLDIRLEEAGLALDELIVSATRADARTPMTFQELEKEELEARNLGIDAPFLLRYTPSAVVTSDAGAGIGYTGIRIRGTDPTRINITINGIPLNDAESQGVFWVNMPDFLSSVEDIQIQRGVGSSTNGAGAFGATINLNTNELHREAYGELNGSAGSFNTWRGNIRLGTGLIADRFTLEGRLSTITSDGYIDRASADLQSYYLSGAWVGEKSLLRINAFSGQEVTYQAWYGVPRDSLATNRTYNPAGTERPGEPYDNQVDNYRQDHYQALFSQEIGTDWNLNLALHYTRGRGYFEEYQADEPFSAYGLSDPVLGGDTIRQTDLIRRLWLDNHFYGGTYGLQWTPQDRLDFTLGGGYHIYEGRHYGEVIWAEYAADIPEGYRFYDNDARKTDFNIFGKARIELVPDLFGYLDLQYRRVTYRFLGLDDDLSSVEQEVDLHFFNPKLGVLYQLAPRQDLYASIAVAQREPNRNDYVDSPPEQRPQPEQLYNLEAGYRGRWGRAAFEANGYLMYYRDQLVLNGQLNEVGAYTRINVPRSYRLGLELVGGYQFSEAWALQGSATFSRNRILAFTEFIDLYDENFDYQGQQAVAREETNLSFSPAIIAAGELSWRPLRRPRHELEVVLNGKYVSRQYIDNSSDADNAIDPYFFSDLRLAYTLKPGFLKALTFSLLVQNLFDAEFETNAWSYRYRVGEEEFVDQGFYPQAGINFLGGVKVVF